MGRFGRVARAVINSASPEPGAYRPTTSGGYGHVGSNLDDAAARLARFKAVQAATNAERLASRGWDWDRSVPDALFHGQTRSAGPADAAVEAAQATRSLNELFDLSDWSDDLL